MTIAGLILFGYQNCGTVENTSGLFSEDSSGFLNCEGLACLSSAEAFLRIRESDPLRFNEDLIVPGLDPIRISGSCGNGIFPESQISWELTEGAGRQAVAQGVVDQACENGRFSVAFPSPADFRSGVIYQVELTIAGVEEGVVFPSGSVAARGSISLVLTSFDFESDSDFGYPPAVQECRRIQREIACLNEGEQSTELPGCPPQTDLDLPCGL